MIYIIGIGSHSEVVYSILIAAGVRTPISFLSYPTTLVKIQDHTTSKTVSEAYKGGSDEWILGKQYDAGHDEFIIAIGDNELRRTVAHSYRLFPLTYLNAIHPRAILNLETNNTLGKGNVFCAGAVIQTGTCVGNHNIFNTNCSVDHHNHIGSFCHIAPNSALCGHVKLHDGVFVGVGASIVPRVTLRPCQIVKANQVVHPKTFLTDILPVCEVHPINKQSSLAIKAIESGCISGLSGTYVKEATTQLKAVLDVPYALLVNNGTSATHALFLALKHFHPSIRRIYVPNNVYVAAWNAVLMEYPLDCMRVMKMDLQTWNICTDPDSIKSLDQNAAVLIVHNVGQVVDVPRLKNLRPDLIFLEDNCEGLFGKYDHHQVSTGCSDAILCASISFYGNKIITSGEGGAVLTTRKDVHDYLTKVCNQGVTEKRYVHDVLGYNYRMTNVQAALLLDQLRDVENILRAKRQVFRTYRSLLASTGSEDIVLPVSPSGTVSAPWMFCVRIPKQNCCRLMEQLQQIYGIDSRPMFYPIRTHKHLSDIHVSDEDHAISLQLHEEIIMLPSAPTLTLHEQKHVIYSLIDLLTTPPTTVGT